jgi:diaminopimelate epimerase
VNGAASVSVNEHVFNGYVINTGNPHFVIFERVSENVRQNSAQWISQHTSFTQGVNVSFAQIETDGIRLNVFERGCGWTQACGTAAIATTAAYWSMHDCEGQAMRVHLPGGTLNIGGTYDDMIMDGPARFTFSGSIGGIWT